jgi:hypothetical protein
MNKFINYLSKLSKWYAIGIVLLYSLLIAELFSTIQSLSIVNSLADNYLYVIFSRIGYVLAILSGVIVWIVSSFIFHLTALLFNGHSSFQRFLYVSPHSYIVPSIMILVAIFLLDNVQISNTEDALNALLNNSSFKLSMNLINP